MTEETLHAMTAFVENTTALLRAKYGDEGAVANMRSAVKVLQASDPDLEDPDFVDACNELATVASLEDPKVIVAETPSPEELKKRSKTGDYKRVQNRDVSAKDSGLV